MTRERKEHKLDLQVCVGEKSILTVHTFELTNPRETLIRLQKQSKSKSKPQHKKLLNSIPQERVLPGD